MAGVGGQNVLMIPSHDLAVVRLGHFKGVGASRAALNKSLALLMEIIPPTK
jgi:hypothetical protein